MKWEKNKFVFFGTAYVNESYWSKAAAKKKKHECIGYIYIILFLSLSSLTELGFE